MTQPNPPNNEHLLQKLQSKPRLLLWFVAAASSAILAERAITWILLSFSTKPLWGLDIPTLLSIAGAAYAIAQWGITRFRATGQIIEGVKRQVESLSGELEEVQIHGVERDRAIAELRAKAEYLEMRVDFNDARINAKRTS